MLSSEALEAGSKVERRVVRQLVGGDDDQLLRLPTGRHGTHGDKGRAQIFDRYICVEKALVTSEENGVWRGEES